MNRKQQMIISVVCITLALLALLGLTYAYYRTRIYGNQNSTSISVTSKELEITYADGNGTIVAESIMPGDTIGPKTFSVTNSGNTIVDNYSVVLEYAVIDGVVPSVFERPEDFQITLTCVDGEGNVCNGTKVNFNNESLTLTTASIEPKETHNYALNVYYNDPGVDQSNDMGKNLNLKVQIYGVDETADLNGVVTGVDETYVVKLTSNPKIASILKNVDEEGNVSYNYSFSGVEMGTHTLRILNKDGVEVSSQNIVLEKGTSTGFSTTTINNVEVPLVTVNDFNRVINLTTSVDTTNNIVQNSGNSVRPFNPYENNKSSLAYNIIKNSESGINGTTYTETPITTPGKEPVGINSSNPESILTKTYDDYGTSYYYRGGVTDNYVNFAGMCWRIVRIAGDGSVKLILEDKNEQCNDKEGNDLNNNGTYYTGNYIIGGTEYGYYTDEVDTSGYHFSGYIKTINYLKYSGGLADEFKKYQTILETKLMAIDESKTLANTLKAGDWCYDDSAYIDKLGTNVVEDKSSFYKDLTGFYFGSYTRIYGNQTASLKCKNNSGESMILNKFADGAPMYVSALTADEVVYAGDSASSTLQNGSHYLINSFQKKHSNSWWILSPATSLSWYGPDPSDWGYADTAFAMTVQGISTALVNSYFGDGGYPGGPSVESYSGHSVRPSIFLKSGTIINGGEGTNDNPYVIG